MGQAKIKRDRQRAEEEKRKVGVSNSPAVSKRPSEPLTGTPVYQKRQALERPTGNAIITSEQFLRLLALSQEQGIKIDYEGVPLERRSDWRFFQSYQQMYDEITDLYWVSAFCLHEAGHRLYLDLLGVTKYEYLPPTIKYNEKIDDYDGHRAAVQAREFNSPEQMPLDQFTWLLAKGLAAGAVLAEHLANAPSNGEEADRDRFDDTCKKLLDTYPQLRSIDTDSAWEQAQSAVLQEMQNPANKEAAFGRAEEIRAEIFPWIKAPITPFPKTLRS